MTRHRLSSLVWLLALIAATLGMGVGSATAAPAPPIQVSVDHAGPSGHNYEFKDFFPRGDTASPLKVAAGGTVQFNWPATPDGFHTAALLRTGTDVSTVWDTFPIAVPDPDDSSSQLQFNPAIAAPTFPPPGSPAPTACGDVAKPCVFDGSADLNSGALANNGTNSFVVQISPNVAPGTTVAYACLIHRGMAAQLTVVDPAGGTATTQPQADSESAAQYGNDLPEAQAAETAANVATTSPNADGTNTLTMSAGTETTHTAVLEFLPTNVAAKAGDKIVWKMTQAMAEIHTITFPRGTESNEPLPQFCEATPTDTPFDPSTAPPGPPCGDPSLFEVHLNPFPAGGTVISSTATEASSGILSPPGGPLPSTYAFTFPATGTFAYFCHIHANGMVGSVEVTAAAAKAVTTTAAFTG